MVWVSRDSHFMVIRVTVSIVGVIRVRTSML